MLLYNINYNVVNEMLLLVSIDINSDTYYYIMGR